MQTEQEHTIAKQAVAYHNQGYNCAEAVTLAFQEALGLPDYFPQLASGFGGGFGRRGSVCGVVSAGVLLLNVRYGRKNLEGDKAAIYDRVLSFYNDFEALFESTSCLTLTGCDLTSKAGVEKFQKEQVSQKTCNRLIAEACKLLYPQLVA